MSLSGRSVELLTDGGAFGFALPASHKGRWKICRLTFCQVPTTDEAEANTAQYSETVNNAANAAFSGVSLLFIIKGGTKGIDVINLVNNPIYSF
jgi:hypothetical protein